MKLEAVVPWVLGVLLLGCDGNPSADQGLAAATGISVWQVAALPDLSLDGTSGAGFFQISAATFLADGSIAIADASNRVSIFGPGGELRSSFGGAGQGPGEFLEIARIQELQPDTVIVIDGRSGRATWTTTAGALVRTLTLPARQGGAPPPRVVGALGNGSVLAVERLLADAPEGGMGTVRPDWVLLRYSERGEFLDSLTVVEGDEIGVFDGVIVPLPTLRRTFIEVGEGEFHVSTGHSFEVRTFGVAGSPPMLLGAERVAAPLTAEMLEEINLPPLVLASLPDTLPATGGLILDRGGHIWLGPYFDGEQHLGTWAVFDLAGEQIAEVAIPRSFRPMDVSDDRLLGVWTDDLGVEFVHTYRVLR